MVQLVLRGLFVLMSAAVAGLYAVRTFTQSAAGVLLTIAATLAVSGLIVLVDVLIPRKRLSAISGVFLGLLVGMLAAYALSFLVAYIAVLFPDIPETLMDGVTVFVGVVCVYLAITLVLQTKDDFRFVIPYVEFAKRIRGPRPLLVDTSAIVDGRILDIAATHVLQGLVIIPRFVLNELQTIADSADKLKRARGRRGLDIVAKMQETPHLEVTVEDAEAEGAVVDQKLVNLALDLHARLVTTDYNLTKVAKLRGVEVININELAEAMRPPVLPGEPLSVRIVKPGESAGQGVGYLEDGTMVVVEGARDRIGRDVALSVTSTLQTSAGRMIFGKLSDEPGGGRQTDRSPEAAGDGEAEPQPAGGGRRSNR